MSGGTIWFWRSRDNENTSLRCKLEYFLYFYRNKKIQLKLECFFEQGIKKWWRAAACLSSCHYQRFWLMLKIHIRLDRKFVSTYEEFKRIKTQLSLVLIRPDLYLGFEGSLVNCPPNSYHRPWTLAMSGVQSSRSWLKQDISNSCCIISHKYFWLFIRRHMCNPVPSRHNFYTDIFTQNCIPPYYVVPYSSFKYRTCCKPSRSSIIFLPISNSELLDVPVWEAG